MVWFLAESLWLEGKSNSTRTANLTDLYPVQSDRCGGTTLILISSTGEMNTVLDHMVVSNLMDHCVEHAQYTSDVARVICYRLASAAPKNVWNRAAIWLVLNIYS